jgi:LemA protein
MEFFIFIWVILIIAIVFISKYNSIVALKNTIDNSIADITVQLKQRFDLVPNLIESVKWYTKHESSVLENVTKARSAWMWASNNDDKLAADNMLTWALKSVFAISENYPELKANENFINLQNELSDIENKIAAARRFLNSATNEYNTFIQSFPNNIVAWMFGFTNNDSFKVENQTEIETAPAVKF